MIELLNSLATSWAIYMLQNSLQMLLYFLLVVAVALLSRWQSATFKYWLWFSVFLVALIPPLITMPVNIPALPLLPDEQVVTQLQDFGTQSQGEVMSGHETTVQISWLGMLFLGWLLVVSAMVLSTVIRTRAFYQKIREQRYPVSQTLLQRCNLPVATPVFWSHTVDTPVTIGFFAPEIILPDEMQEWGDGEISAILWHEYAHVRRRDNLLLIVQHLAHAVFFFHPIIWVSRYFSGLYQEQACDDLALLSNDMSPYNISRSLIRVMKQQRSTFQAMMSSGFLTSWTIRARVNSLYSKGENRMIRLKMTQKILMISITISGILFSCASTSDGPNTDIYYSPNVIITEEVDRTAQFGHARQLLTRLNRISLPENPVSIHDISSIRKQIQIALNLVSGHVYSKNTGPFPVQQNSFHRGTNALVDGLNAFQHWLNTQGCVSRVEIPQLSGGMQSGWILNPSFPAQMPLRVYLITSEEGIKLEYLTISFNSTTLSLQ
jgi:beta-lactamase regulating signal transducer with metallopeptidase domain